MSTTVLVVQGTAERAGAERVLLGLLANADPRRIRPVVAFLGDGPFASEVAALGVEVVHLPPVGRLRQPTGVPAAIRHLRAAIRDTGADVVHAAGEKVALLACPAARTERVPAVVRLHDGPAPWRAPASIGVQLVAAAVPKTSVVVPSQWMAEAFFRRCRLHADVIPNGIDLARLPAPGSGRADVLSATGWPADAVVFAHAGRLESWKGTDVFLKAAGRLIEDPAAERARFLIVGGALYGRDERWAAGLPALANELGLGDRVHFTGFRPDALHLLAGADAVVHASTRPEPFGMVVIEGMALGATVIASAIGGPSEVIDHGRTGLLAAPGRPETLAAAMHTVASDDDLRRRLGAAAREAAERSWSAATMARRWTDHWEAVAGGAATRTTGSSAA